MTPKNDDQGQFARVCKVDTKHGLVLGWAIVCKQDGVDYYDLQDEHVPEDVMFEAAVDFAAGARAAREMHRDGSEHGQCVFAFPMTSDVAKSLGIDTGGTSGLLIGMKPGADVLAKFQSGEYTGFSIGGRATYEGVAKLAPKKGEKKDQYLSRFMGDEKMRSEYPDEKQRAAVAYSMFGEEAGKAKDEHGYGSEGRQGGPKVGDRVVVGPAGGQHAGKSGLVTSVSRAGDLAGVDHSDGTH
ncbi:MAG: XkdF-like putative serine protease domain-containing protein, partial [Actinoallomurus sp.]